MKSRLLLIVALLCSPLSFLAQAAGGSDTATIRDRYVVSLLPTAVPAMEQARAQALKFASSLSTEGNWSDVDYTGTDRAVWVTCDHLERVAIMARAARLARNAGHADEALVTKTLLALHWWIDKDYKNSNWWWNEIHVPQLMGEIGNLLAPQIPPVDVAAMVTIMKRSDWEHGPKHTWSGANLSDSAAIQIARGCIEDSDATVAQAFNRMYQEITVVTPPEQGIQPDDSFHQHGNQLYNGGYGMGFAIVSVRLANLARETRFEIPADRMAILVNYLLDGEQWIMRGKLVDYSTLGRGLTRETKVLAVNRGSVESRRGLGGLIAVLASNPVPRQKELQTFAARLNGTPGAAEQSGNRHFWYSDYMVHRRAGYSTSVKMLSKRMQNAELVNLEGKKSVHLSDGANYLYISGDEYTNVFVGWDWAHVPGTTAIQGTLDTGEKNPIAVTGTTTFDGGVSDGTYGMAAMDLARGSLTAKKAWFFFDTSYVALGAGITLAGDTTHAVATDVNQALLNGAIVSNQARGSVAAGTQSYSAKGGLSVLHNHVGYIFAPDSNVTLFSGPRTGIWSDIGAGPGTPVTVPVFDLWIDHGLAPKDAAYQYTVVPNATEEQLARLSKTAELVVLSNTANLQAVYSPGLKLAEVAFRQPGSLKTPLGEIQADHSCLLLVRQTASGWLVTASNPENEALTLNLAVKGHKMAMQLPGGNLAGSSISAELK